MSESTKAEVAMSTYTLGKAEARRLYRLRGKVGLAESEFFDELRAKIRPGLAVAWNRGKSIQTGTVVSVGGWNPQSFSVLAQNLRTGRSVRLRLDQIWESITPR